MLKIPEKDFKRSINKSNVERSSLADWIEASALFSGPSVSRSDVVDILLEEQICDEHDSQNLAHQIAEDGWDECERRVRITNMVSDLTISAQRLQYRKAWDEDLIRSFLLLLSLFRIYPDWASSHRQSEVQGALFEQVVEAICPHLLPGWSTYRVGWSPQSPKGVPEIVDELANLLYVRGEPDLDYWVGSGGGDGGLDLVCYRDFKDEREAMPLLFLQCASGNDWRYKLTTPSGPKWRQLLNSAVEPSTGIAIPYVIDTKAIRMAALEAQGVIFDRIRLLSAARHGNVVIDGGLRIALMDWMQPKVIDLPQSR